MSLLNDLYRRVMGGFWWESHKRSLATLPTEVDDWMPDELWHPASPAGPLPSERVPPRMAGGSATDIRINADLILQMKQELSALNAQHTGKSVEQILEDSDRDKWFTAREALDYGFVDHIIEHSSSVVGGGGVDRGATAEADEN